MDAKKLAKMKSTRAAVSPTEHDVTTLISKLKAVRGVKGVSRKNLRKRVTKLIASARKHKAALLKVDWTEEMTDSLEQSLADLDKVSTSNAKDKLSSEETTDAYKVALAKGLALRTRLVAKLERAGLMKPEVLEKTPIVLGKIEDASDLVQWFTENEAVMERLRPELEKVSSTDWFAQVAKQQAALNKAVGLHAQRSAVLAGLAEKKLAARNKVVSQMQALYVHARDAFVSNPRVKREFNKTLPRQQKAKSAVGDAKTTKASSTSTESTGDPTASSPTPPSQPAAVDPSKAQVHAS